MRSSAISMHRKYRLPLFGTVAAAFVVGATWGDVALAKPPAEWGGFGHAFFGGALNGYGNFENEMAAPRALGDDFSISPLGMQFGGGGKFLIAGTILVGGKGMGWAMSADQSQGANVSLTGGGGGFDIGYAAYNQDQNLLYPYFGLGGYALEIEMQNRLATQSIAFGSARVAPDATDTFSAGFFTFDFGVGFQRLLFFGDGGLTVGAEGGVMIPILRGAWQGEDENEISGLEELGVSGGYLRITLGGGGFIFGDDPSLTVHETAAR